MHNDIMVDSPPIHLHVLCIEEEDGGWNQGDIKVLKVGRHAVHIDQVNGSHLCKLWRCLCHLSIKRNVQCFNKTSARNILLQLKVDVMYWCNSTE